MTQEHPDDEPLDDDDEDLEIILEQRKDVGEPVEDDNS